MSLSTTPSWLVCLFNISPHAEPGAGSGASPCLFPSPPPFPHLNTERSGLRVPWPCLPSLSEGHTQNPELTPLSLQALWRQH